MNIKALRHHGSSVFLGLIFYFGTTAALAQDIFYAIDSEQPFLSVVDPATGNELSFVQITVPGILEVDGVNYRSGNGLAIDPVTGEFYAAIKFQDQAGPGRNLVLLDPATGIGTDLGNMGQPIAGMAFSSDGVLYGVTGDCANNCGGAAIAETLFTINTATAALTQVQALGNGNDGEAIGFNPEDGMMYHMSGKGAGLIFERINLATGVVTPIALSGDPVLNRESIGFAFDAAAKRFVGSLIDWDTLDAVFFSITSTGFIEDLGPLQFPWKDYAALRQAVEPLGRFDDVLPDYWAFSFVETLAQAGITGGCRSEMDPAGFVTEYYCPEDSVTRAQMAVFLERGINGSDFAPPAASGNLFLDVGTNDFAAAFIEQLFLDGITGGCGNNNYCPNDAVTRAQMAVFLLRAKYGSAYTPPPATGVAFGDVDSSYWAVAWVEQLAAEGITGGCGNGNYCPAEPVTRAQMAVFLVRTFGL